MTPWRDGQSGSFVIDRRVRGLGRIKRASGTTDPKVFKKINRAISQLADQGRLDVLRALRDGAITAAELLDAYQRGETAALPTAKSARPLVAAWGVWIAKKDCGAAHKRSLAQSLRHLKPNADTRIADLPALLDAARDRLRAKPQSFRLCRAACQAFVKSMLKRSHPLYADVSAVELLRIRAKRVKHPATVEELQAIGRRASSDGDTSVAQIISTGALTGMRVNELWGKWDVWSDRVVIHGTKTRGAERIVPLVSPMLFKPTISYKAFLLALRDASDGQMTPYDLRRTYANWLEAAGIPRTRRKLYMGHGAGDVTGLYEWHEVERFLAEDAEKMRQFLGISHERSHGIRLEKASSHEG